MRLDQIQRSDGEVFVKGLGEKGYSEHSIQDVVKCFGKCLRWAVKHKVISENPVKRLGPLYRQAPVRKKEPNPFNRDDAMRFLRSARELCPSNYYFVFMLALKTGLRSGEI